MILQKRLRKTATRLFASGLMLSAPAMMSLNETAKPSFSADMYRNSAYRETVERDLPAIRKSLAGLTLDTACVYPPPVERYFRYYGLQADGAEHRFGSFAASGYRLAAHLWLPPDYDAMVIVLHGYLTHTGTMDRLIRRLVREGCAVAAFDLPGHGLSDGPRVAIDSFAVYGEVFGRFVDLLRTVTDKPLHVVAHSTGGATVLQHLFANPEADGLGNIVLVAPLVRSALWEISKIGYKVAKNVVDQVPRVVMVKISSDKDFLDFIEEADPLQAKDVPLIWVNALFQWNEWLETRPASSRPFTVIQGDKDRVVDWKYNVPFIRKHFPAAEPVMIEKGRHELLNESEAIRDSVIQRVLERLGR